MSLFHGPTQDIPTVTWEYAINDIQLNASITDEPLNFDQTSVDRIYDGDKQAFIEVKK